MWKRGSLVLLAEYGYPAQIGGFSSPLHVLSGWAAILEATKFSRDTSPVALPAEPALQENRISSLVNRWLLKSLGGGMEQNMAVSKLSTKSPTRRLKLCVCTSTRDPADHPM